MATSSGAFVPHSASSGADCFVFSSLHFFDNQDSMKKLLLLPLFAILASISTPLSAQTVLVSDSLMQTYTPLELLFEGVFGAENGVATYRIVYNTVDHTGATIQATGAVAVPLKDSCYFPILSYAHGTVHRKIDVPGSGGSEIALGLNMGAFGYLTVMPDYIGLGGSPGFHPYVHAETEATAIIDAIRATEEFCSNNNIMLNEQLFMTGYSQGGHATMAAHKMIQDQFSTEFNVVANAPCSAPLSLDSIMAAPMLSPQPYDSPDYLPYVLFSYDMVYDIYDSVQQVIKEPWATTLPPLFDGTHTGTQINAAMPNVPSQILQDTFLTDFGTNPQNPMRIALKDNNLYDWTPVAPVHMWACEADELVFYTNSELALSTMTANGAADVELASAGANLDHVSCAIPALLSARGWFDTLKGACDEGPSGGGTSVEETPMAEKLQMYPNPMSREAFIVLPQDHKNYQLQVRDMNGRIVRQENQLPAGAYRFDRQDLPSGIYLLEAQSEGVLHQARLVIQ